VRCNGPQRTGIDVFVVDGVDLVVVVDDEQNQKKRGKFAVRIDYVSSDTRSGSPDTRPGALSSGGHKLKESNFEKF
jgi:hypothetical protein